MAISALQESRTSCMVRAWASCWPIWVLPCWLAWAMEPSSSLKSLHQESHYPRHACTDLGNHPSCVPRAAAKIQRDVLFAAIVSGACSSRGNASTVHNNCGTGFCLDRSSRFAVPHCSGAGSGMLEDSKDGDQLSD